MGTLATAIALALASCGDKPVRRSAYSAGAGGADLTTGGTPNDSEAGSESIHEAAAPNSGGGAPGSGGNESSGAGTDSGGQFGAAGASEPSGEGGGRAGESWRFTPVVDGSVDEWPNEARLGHSSGSFTYIAWDSDNLYVAVVEAAIFGAYTDHWLVVYSGSGDAGAPQGVLLNTQQPALPFAATRAVRWKLDDSTSVLDSWDGVSWDVSTPFFGVGGAALIASGSVAEMAIPLSSLGIDDHVMIVLAMVRTTDTAEETYAACPAGAINNLFYDPDYTHYWHFDFTAAIAPVMYSESP
jgi:hypothetical protein